VSSPKIIGPDITKQNRVTPQNNSLQQHMSENIMSIFRRFAYLWTQSFE